MVKKSFYSIFLLFLLSISMPVQAGISFSGVFSMLKEYVCEKRGWHDAALIGIATAGLTWWMWDRYTQKPKEKPVSQEKAIFCFECVENYQLTYLKKLEEARVSWFPYGKIIEETDANLIGQIACDKTSNVSVSYKLSKNVKLISLKPYITFGTTTVDKKFAALTKEQDSYYITLHSIVQNQISTASKIECPLLKEYQNVAMSYLSYCDKDYVCLLCSNDQGYKLLAYEVKRSVLDLHDLTTESTLVKDPDIDDEARFNLKAHLAEHVFNMPAEAESIESDQSHRWCTLL